MCPQKPTDEWHPPRLRDASARPSSRRRLREEAPRRRRRAGDEGPTRRHRGPLAVALVQVLRRRGDGVEGV